jgi:GNAT superfamily N-acetyltransferase
VASQEALTHPKAARAAAASHRSWFRAWARARGGEVRRRGGGLLAYTPNAERGGAIQVLFVEPQGDLVAVVDELLDWIAALPRLRSVGWWTLSTEDRAALTPVLMARGFQWGWRPHWMWCDLATPAAARPLPEGVATACFPDAWDEPPVPEPVRAFGEDVRAITTFEAPATTVLAAYDQEGAVGSVSLHVGPPGTRGADGGTATAGIYDVWVAERAQRRGIGAALMAAALERARELGCRVATLNATADGARLYRRLGFRSAGWGQTWWLVEYQLSRPRADAESVRFVEAIARGDLGSLDRALATLGAERRIDLDAELLCAETPLGLAVRAGQAGAARWLVEHGARLDVLTAWDLGWRDKAADLLRDKPALADFRADGAGPTPLMVAARRGDDALAELLLAAAPDLSLRDAEWHGDALGWAEHYGRLDMARRIREAARQRGKAPGRGPA